MRLQGSFLAGALVCALLFSLSLAGQQPTGSISGVVSDPTGAVVPAADITVANKATGVIIQTKTSGAGAYTVSSLLPGAYEVRVASEGFKTTQLNVVVQVGSVSAGSVELELGERADSVIVESSAVVVNPIQTSVEGVITEALIRDLPLNGRNFLDLGQLEPGVQAQDASNTSLFKGQFTALSIGSSTGSSTRVTVDGVDVSDEILGTTTMNLSQDSIREFQISRATFDVSTDITESGAVNVVTKSGSNRIHGTGFFFGRSNRLAARIGQEDADFDRQQIGFNLGGPFIRDRLFWFVNYERSNQDGVVATLIPSFPQFTNTWQKPFDERFTTARLDWNIKPNLRTFFRFNHNWNNAVASGALGLGGANLTAQANQNITNQTVVGVDASTGLFTHSFRYGHLNANTHVVDARDQVPGLPRTLDPAGRDILIRFSGQGGFAGIGPNPIAPTRNLQENQQFRYDGGVVFGRHAVRWGTNLNLIEANLFQPFQANGTDIQLLVNGNTRAAIVAAGLDPLEPLNYPVFFAFIWNALGWATETPSLGFPFGGFKNARFNLYLADTWKATRRLTVNFGVRYFYEPGQANSDLDKPALLDDFLPGLSRRTRFDNNNLAPQFGLALDPTGAGKTVIRAGAGIYYSPVRFSQRQGERTLFLPPGITPDSRAVPFQPLIDPNTGGILWDGTCCGGQSINGLPANTPGLIDAVIANFEAFKAAAQVATANFPSGPTRFEQNVETEGNLFDPDFQTPYSIHLNAGVQRELRPGLVLSVDFLFQRGLHLSLQQDNNRVGAADTLDVGRAEAAMISTHGAFGCPQDASPASVDCAIANGATIRTYGNFGLGRCEFALSGIPNPCAFPGRDPNFNRMRIRWSQGKSEYKALQVSLRGRLPDLGSALRDWRTIFSYSLSRLKATNFDPSGTGSTGLFNNDDPVRSSFGPSALDRTHILSVANLFAVPMGIRINSIWRVNSALPQRSWVPSVAGGGSGEIFTTDFDGDGTAVDLLPGTGRGSFGRNVGSIEELNALITNFNDNVACTLTPAGRAVVDAGLFSESQLGALGGTANACRSVPLVPADQVMLDSFMTTDLRISRPFKLWREKVTIEASWEVFNLFNVANYDLPSRLLSGALDGRPGSISGTTATNRPNRAGFGSGSFAPGIPRAMQFAVRVSF